MADEGKRKTLCKFSAFVVFSTKLSSIMIFPSKHSRNPIREEVLMIAEGDEKNQRNSVERALHLHKFM